MNDVIPNCHLQCTVCGMCGSQEDDVTELIVMEPMCVALE